MVERTRYEPGEFCWVGLATSDPPRAKAFYGHLFGWQAEDLQAPEIGTFTILRLRGKNVAFLYRQTREARAARVTPHWTSFISVNDADATAVRAEALGSAAVRDSFAVMDTGRVATLRDPTGAIVSLWEPRSMVGAEVLGDVGSLCWNELATNDVTRAMSFYGDLFDWKYENDSGCIAIENAGSSNGGMRAQSEHEQGSAPNWIPYFSVERADQAAERAERAGGRILRGGDICGGRFAGRVALITDPLGAVFGVLGIERHERRG